MFMLIYTCIVKHSMYVCVVTYTFYTTFGIKCIYFNTKYCFIFIPKSDNKFITSVSNFVSQISF